MIAKYVNRTVVAQEDSYMLLYFSDSGELLEYSFGGVLFEAGYTQMDMEERASTIAANIYPEETLSQVIIE